MIGSQFVRTLAGSVYSPALYGKVITQPKRVAVKFYLKLAILLALLLALGTWQAIAWLVKFEAHPSTYLSQVTSVYPAGLVVTIKDGHASSNQTEPYTIPIPSSWKGAKDDQTKNLVVIDTKTAFSPEQFQRYQTVAWLTGDALYYGSSGSSSAGSAAAGDIRVLSLGNVPNTVIDRAYVDSLVGKVRPWLQGLAPVAVVLILVMLYVAELFKLVYLFVLAALVWLLSRLVGRKLAYGQAYVTGLYAASVPFVISVAAMALGHPLFVFAVTIVALVIAAANLLRLPRSAGSGAV